MKRHVRYTTTLDGKPRGHLEDHSTRICRQPDTALFIDGDAATN